MRTLHAEKFKTKDERKKLEFECRRILENASFEASKAPAEDRGEIVRKAVSAAIDRIGNAHDEAVEIMAKCAEEGELHVTNCDVQRLNGIASLMLQTVASSRDEERSPYLAVDIRRIARSIYCAIGFDWRDWGEM